ncbi:hypothetical protein BY458DRAFT_492854 [Sporodiniella umbellata]|nr:hypothetical protein BY458DRAFT_492854 [Sporodiniella umbellata]
MTEDFDEFDLKDFVAAADTAEKVHRSGKITFVPDQDQEDPTPPACLPEDTPSFHPLDVENLRTWIYPINYPIRGYQLNIVQKALFHNTLVALPTGLGKTFIAAVVMYNYWRWFPNSKVIFMAPTRPLVDQQIEACFHICGLPQADTCDMTGSTSPAARQKLWRTKRVFFATPQTVQKDIITRSCPVEYVACVVVDEAHKATGNYAYVEVISRIAKKQSCFRVLALTATPGSNLDAVQDVITNLCITNIQIRTEESMDIREYSHGKNIQNIIVRLSYTEGARGGLPAVINRFREKVFKPVLVDLSKFPTNVTDDPDQWGSYRLRSARVYFTTTAKNFNKNLTFLVISTFLIAEALSRAYERLCTHGIVSFLDTMDDILNEIEEKNRMHKKLTVPQAKLNKNSTVKYLVDDLKQKKSSPDFTSHPKIERLLAILVSHFGNLEDGKASKVMIFSSYRSSVMDICEVLARHHPLIRATHFVGQATSKKGAKGLKQIEQQEVIEKFKSDSYNVIVSTSIGEEGLDIGEVDLIICYDTQASPIRMLQRMGRTGRKRQGKCIMLMTEQEDKKFTQAKETYTRIQRLITQSGTLNYYRYNPKILPENYKPTIERKVLVIGSYQSTNKRKRMPGHDRSMISAEGKLTESGTLSLLNFYKRSSINEILSLDWPSKSLRRSLNNYLPLNTHEKPSFRVGHSRRTLDFIHLVKRIEHRILHPGEEDNLPKRQQTQMILPKKRTKKKKRYDEDSLAINDDDFQEFLEANNTSNFLDPSEAFSGNEVEGNSSRSMQETLGFPHDAIEEVDSYRMSGQQKNFKSNGQRINSRNENTSSENSSDLNVKLESIEFRNFSNGTNDLMNSVLYSLEDNKVAEKPKGILKTEDLSKDNFIESDAFGNITSETEQKTTDSWKCFEESVKDKGKLKERNSLDEGASEKSWEALLPPSVYEDYPTTSKTSSPSFLTSSENFEDDFGDIDDIDFGDAFELLEPEVQFPKGCFEDYTIPRFPIEVDAIYDTSKPTIVWESLQPVLSKKAYTLFLARQAEVKKATGKLVATGIVQKNEAESSGSDHIVEVVPGTTEKDYSVEAPKETPQSDSIIEFDFDLFSNMDEFDIADLIENRMD